MPDFLCNVNIVLKEQIMKIQNVIIASALLILSACASIPKEVVTLSQTLGDDLKVLHNSHVNAVHIYFVKMKDEINSLVDETYAPFVIHYVLKSELASYQEGEASLYGTIELAGKKEGQKEANDAINVMMEFQEAARTQIESKRNDLLSPLKNQETEILKAVNQSYENAIYANSSITAYLQSIRKLKEGQQLALSKIGLEGADIRITDSLLKLSTEIGEVTRAAKKIDIQSDDAFQQLEKVSNQIKEITSKK
tara:strand:- start:8897 stop:9652 length:756 start_codon:yes stop_codon:yes gene_type:complete